MNDFIKISGPKTEIELKKLPVMGGIFLKGFFLSFLRPDTVDATTRVKASSIVLKNYIPDPVIIENYKKVCGFKREEPTIPASYLQTVFVGLLGKYIVSSFFPLNPLGLIHTFQSFDQKRPVKIDENLDLSCSLTDIVPTEKGIESHFLLEVIISSELVWQGSAVFLTRKKAKKAKKKNIEDEVYLAPKETVNVPTDIGRQYAKVSGDYNPYHLYGFFAKIFGFKSAIAHGMWSMARVVACLDTVFTVNYPFRVETSFKLPVYLPARLNIGFEAENNTDEQTEIRFELRDEQKGLPHLKGRLFY